MTLRLSWKKPYFNSNSIFQVTILATAFGDEKFQALWRKMLSGKKLTHFSAACRCHVAGCPPLICLISGHISPFWCYTSVLYSLTRSSVILHSICFEIPLISISQKHSFMQQQKEHLRHPGLRLVKLLGLPTKLTIFAARFCQFLVFFRCPEGYPGWKKNRAATRLASVLRTHFQRQTAAELLEPPTQPMTCQTYQISSNLIK